MLNLDDLFGDRLHAIRERDKAFLPDVEWFSNMPPDRLGTYMTKYPFTSFEAIPKDDSGLTFPSFEDLAFYPPPLLRTKPTRIVNVDGMAFLKVLGEGAFCIDPRRWHKIKTYIAKGTVEYPEASVNRFGVSDGRHRTLLLMKLYNRTIIPVAIPEHHYDEFMSHVKSKVAV